MPRPSRPWFRFYVEAVHDRKLRRLKPEYRWLFVACLAAARQSCEPGVLLVGEHDPMTVDDLVDFAGMPRSQVTAGMQALVLAGVVRVDKSAPRERFVIPAWGERQYESDDVTARTRNHRKERSNDVPGNVPEAPVGTPPETEAETDTETPPTPLLDQIVELVFERTVADKERRGERITSVSGLRTYWDEHDGAGCRKRAAYILKQYPGMSLSQYADVTRSPRIPAWANPYLKRNDDAEAVA